jgi:hypothetical protein
MEYFDYDYSRVNSDLTFKNYENFITNRRAYKHYLFDLGLIRYDVRMPRLIKDRASDIIKIQKLFMIVPYPLVLARLYYLHRRNFFSVNILEREFKMVVNMFIFVLTVRVAQKLLLKYQADEVLKEANHYKV